MMFLLPVIIPKLTLRGGGLKIYMVEPNCSENCVAAC